MLTNILDNTAGGTVNSQSHWKQGSQENDLMCHWSPASRNVASLDTYMHDWRCKTKNICKNKKERWSLLSKTSELRRPKCLYNLKNSKSFPGCKYHWNAYNSFQVTYLLHWILFSVLFHFLTSVSAFSGELNSSNT